MPYCSRCGVEVENQTITCPLCKTPVQNFDSENQPLSYFPPNTLPQRVIRRKWTKGTTSFLLTVIFLIPTALLFTADYIASYSIEWAFIPTSALFMVWALTLILTWTIKRPILLVSLLFTNLVIFLIILNFAIPNGNRHFLPLALAIATSTFMLFLIFSIYCVYTTRKGFNIIGGFLLIAGLIPLCIDLFIKATFFHRNGLTPSWSFFVLFSCLPLALFFFYLHYTRKIYPSFRRFFHL